MPEPHPVVMAIARAVRQAGGRAFLVGGWVRDHVVAPPLDSPAEHEYDIEVYGLTAERLAALLGTHGAVRLVGESFAVYKVIPPGIATPPLTIDVSLPRRDTKVAPGHRGFQVTGDPGLSFEAATRRRDFTMNAMLHDPLDGTIIDPWGGRADIAARLIRVVDPATFVEDSLRVLRAAQFAARLEFGIDPRTIALCGSIDLSDLPRERIWGEIEKILLRARRPSLGFEALDRMGAIDTLFPELAALKGCPQEPEWHPEGDVWVHTLLAIDRAREEAAGLPRDKRLAVLLAVLCHDLGKPATTAVIEGRIRSHDHEAAGVAPTRALLDRLGVHTLGGYPLRDQVIALVAQHLTPSHYYKSRAGVGDGAFRRLARRLEPELLYRVSRADCLGRTGSFSTEAQEWFIERVRALGVQEKPPRPLLMGRHLLEMGLAPGPLIGRITGMIYEMQLDGRVTTLEQARAEARRLLPAGEDSSKRA